jgi:hypothetical protein
MGADPPPPGGGARAKKGSIKELSTRRKHATSIAPPVTARNDSRSSEIETSLAKRMGGLHMRTNTFNAEALKNSTLVSLNEQKEVPPPRS